METTLRAGGWAALVAGIVGAVIGLSVPLIPPAVPASDYTYPLSHGWFAAIQVVLGLHHTALAFGLWAFWRAGLAGRGRGAAIGAVVSIAATAVLAVWEVVAIAGTGLPYPSDETAWLDTGYGALTLASGVGLVIYGVATARARSLTGWARWNLLVLGVYVFVPMLPAIFAGFVVGRVTLSVWSLLFAALGVVMLRYSVRDRATERVQSAAA